MVTPPDVPLADYERKRDFTRTAEPKSAARPDAPRPLFVIQKHHARRLHYDVRLECDGVLKSWAVPMGPSLDPAQKRLAVPTEDHPLEYADFEGVIPKGQYGGGTVLVWDRGIYLPLDEDHHPVALPDDPDKIDRVMREGYRKGRLRFWLHGARLHGGWALVRTDRDQEKWLMVKMRDERADPAMDPTDDPTSVMTGRRIEDVHRDEGTPEEAARRLAARRRKAQQTDGGAP